MTLASAHRSPPRPVVVGTPGWSCSGRHFARARGPSRTAAVWRLQRSRRRVAYCEVRHDLLAHLSVSLTARFAPGAVVVPVKPTRAPTERTPTHEPRDTHRAPHRRSELTAPKGNPFFRYRIAVERMGADGADFFSIVNLRFTRRERRQMAYQRPPRRHHRTSSITTPGPTTAGPEARACSRWFQRKFTT